MNFTLKMLQQSMNAATLPPIGDERKVYDVQLTEPEINAIHAIVAFFLSATAPAFPRIHAHYGPTAKHLSDRLAAFDDGDAPFNGAAS